MQKGRLWVGKVKWFRHFHGSIVSTWALCKCLLPEVRSTGTSMYAPHRWYNTRHSRRQPCTNYGVNRHSMETSCRTSSYRIVMKLQYKNGLDTEMQKRELLLGSRVQHPISWIVNVSVFSSIPFTQQTRREHTDPCGSRPTAPTSILSIGLPFGTFDAFVPLRVGTSTLRANGLCLCL